MVNPFLSMPEIPILAELDALEKLSLITSQTRSSLRLRAERSSSVFKSSRGMFNTMSAILDQAFLKRTNLGFFKFLLSLMNLDEGTKAAVWDSRCVRLWPKGS